MEDSVVFELVSEALQIIRGSINYGEALLEGGVDKSDLDGVSEQIMSQDCAALLLNKGVHYGGEGVKVCKELQESGKMDYNVFVSTLCQSIEILDIGVLVKLLEEQVLSFLKLLNNKHVYQYLKDRAGQPNEMKENSHIRQLWRLLVCEAYDRDMESSSEEIGAVTNTPKSFLTEYFQDCLCELHYDCLLAIIEIFTDTQSSQKIKEFLVEMFLAKAVIHPPVLAVAEAFGCCEDPVPSSPEMRCISQMVGMVRNKRLLDILHSLLCSKMKLNWKFVLLLINSLHSRTSLAELLSGYVQRSIEEAVTQTNSDILLRMLLIAQVVNADKYRVWFEQTFGRSSFNQKHVDFIISTLTTVVPYQPIHVLKAHLEVLSSKQSDFSIVEFLQLIRTRLSDLNVEPSSNGKGEAEESMKKWLVEYKNTYSIPQGMIKASVFLSPFFVGHVLPQLLCPSETDQEVRDHLIEELMKRGKIPKKMYSQYVARKLSPEELKCEEVNGCVLSSIMCDMVKTFVSKLHSDGVFNYNRDSSGTVCNFHMKIKGTIGFLSQVEFHDLLAPALLPWQIQAADALISTVVQETFSMEALGTMSIVSSVFEVVYQNELILWPYLVRLWELVQDMMIELSEVQLRGVSSITSHFLTSCKSFALPIQSSSLSFKSVSEWGLYLIECLPMNTGAGMKASYRFLHFCYLFLQGIEDMVVPQQLAAKMSYLHNRFRYLSTDAARTEVMVDINYDCQLSFSCWIAWELQVEPGQDFLHMWEREAYMENTSEKFIHHTGGSGCLHEDAVKAIQLLLVSLCQSERPSYLLGVSLLQKLLWTSMQSTMCNNSLLAEGIAYIMNQSDAKIYYHSIIKLLCIIPANFLFTNNPMESMTNKDLKTASGCIKHILKMSIGYSFVLPSSLVFHIAKALKMSSIVEEFCSMDKIYHSSLLTACSSRCDSLESEGTSISSFMSPRLIKEVQSLASCDWGGLCEAIPAEVVGLCMFETCLKACNDRAQILEHVTLFLKHAYQEAIEVFFYCCLYQLSNFFFNSNSAQHLKYLEIAQKCLEWRPSLIVLCAKDLKNSSSHIQTFRYVYQITEEQFPCLFFSVLHGLSDAALATLCTLGPSFLHICLGYHSQILQLQYLSHLELSEAFDIIFIRGCIKTTKHFIKATRHKCKACTYHWTMKYYMEQELLLDS